MDKRSRRLRSIMFGVIVAVDVVAWLTIAASCLMIINGGRWKMIIPLVISVVAVWACGELADFVDDKI